MCELKKLNYSPSWFAQNTGLPLIPPLDKDYHSFYVLTKEHFDNMKPLFTFSYLKNNIVACSKEAIERYTQDTAMRELYAQKKLFAAHDEIFSDMLKSNQVHSFKIENLDEIRNIIIRFVNF